MDLCERVCGFYASFLRTTHEQNTLVTLGSHDINYSTLLSRKVDAFAEAGRGGVLLEKWLAVALVQTSCNIWDRNSKNDLALAPQEGFGNCFLSRRAREVLRAQELSGRTVLDS